MYTLGMSKFNHEDGLRAIGEAVGVLKSQGIDVWIQDGTLLGAVRDNKIIEWDHDLDLGVYSWQWTSDCHNALINNGFTLKSSFNRPESDYQQHWVKYGVKFDIFHYYKEQDGRIWHGMKGGRFRFYYPREFHLAPVSLMGKEFPAPYPPQDFLKTKYGNDWRTPKKKWLAGSGPKNSKKVREERSPGRRGEL
jgi:hypothetical protein